MIYYIYGLKCPITNDIRYIGQTKRTLHNRRLAHIHEYNRAKKSIHIFTPKFYWFRELEVLNLLSSLIIELIEICDSSNVNEREIYWISEYGDKILNISPGGSLVSPISVQKQKNSKIGNRNPMFGSIMSNSQKIKMANGRRKSKLIYSPLSIERKTKISQKLRKSTVLLDNMGKPLMKFKNLKDVSVLFDMSYANIKKARQYKRAFGKSLGYKFYIMYEEDFLD